jgi:hypothetical protein
LRRRLQKLDFTAGELAQIDAISEEKAINLLGEVVRGL